MPQTMTLDEKLAISGKAIKLKEAGDKEGYYKVMKTAPLPSYIAKIIKEKVGPEYLIKSGWNLSEAEEKFGSDWLCN
jgi:hypothetical protein